MPFPAPRNSLASIRFALLRFASRTLTLSSAPSIRRISHACDAAVAPPPRHAARRLRQPCARAQGVGGCAWRLGRPSAQVALVGCAPVIEPNLAPLMTMRPPTVAFVSLRAPSNLTVLTVEMLAVTTDVANCETSSLAALPVRLSPMNVSAVSSMSEARFSRADTTDGGTSPLFAIEPLDLPSLKMCASQARPSSPS